MNNTNKLNELHNKKESIIENIKNHDLKEMTINEAIKEMHNIDIELAKISKKGGN